MWRKNAKSISCAAFRIKQQNNINQAVGDNVFLHISANVLFYPSVLYERCVFLINSEWQFFF